MIEPIAKFLGEWSASITLESIFFRIFLAIVLSAIIGWERSIKRHSAGLRTFMILSLSATFVGLLDMFLMENAGVNLATTSAVSVIAFAILCSNTTVFTSKNQIKGLTTSFTLWACGIIGLCIGMGFYTVSVVGVLIMLCCINLFPSMETYLKNRSNHFEIFLELSNKTKLSEFVSIVRRLGLRIDDIEYNSAYHDSGLSVYMVALTVVSPELKKYKTHKEIIEAISSLEYVKHIEEMR